MKTLLFGNTGYISKEFIEEAFPNSDVYIFGETNLTGLKRVTVFKKTEAIGIAEILENYRFDQILYLSNFLTYKNQQIGELERLQDFLKNTSKLTWSKIIYLTGPEIINLPQDLERAAENLCLHWAHTYSGSLKIIRSPYVYSATQPEDYFYGLMSNIRRNQPIRFDEQPDEVANFINSEDLAELVYKVFNSWTDEIEVLTIPSPFQDTFQQLANKLQNLELSHSTIGFQSSNKLSPLYQTMDKNNLSGRYGWFIHYSILDDLSDLYCQFASESKPLRRLEFRGLKKNIYRLRGHNDFQKTAEILLAFLLSEVLSFVVARFNQLGMIDVRLLFVTLISTIFGTVYGVFAGVLSVLGLFVTSIAAGNKWQSIVYNTDRWLPFAAYIFVALICGIIQMKYQDEKELLEKENQLLNEQNDFLTLSYEDAAHDRDALVQKVVSSSNGNSQLYAVHKRLNKKTVEEVIAEAEKIIGEEFSTDEVHFYPLSPFSNFKIELYPQLKEGLEKEAVWINKKMLPDYPVFAVEMKSASGLHYLIWVDEVSYDQLTFSKLHFLQMVSELTASMVDKAGYYQVFSSMNKDSGLTTHSSPGEMRQGN